LCSSGYKLVDEKNKIIFFENKHYHIKNFQNYLSYKNIFGHSTIMYRKICAKSVGWYSNKLTYAQDYDLTVKILAKYKFVFLKNFFVKISVNSKSMTNSKVFWINKVNENLIILRKIRNLYNLTFINTVKNYYSVCKEIIKIYLSKCKII